MRVTISAAYWLRHCDIVKHFGFDKESDRSRFKLLANSRRQSSPHARQELNLGALRANQQRHCIYAEDEESPMRLEPLTRRSLHNVRPYLGPDYLQRLAADETGRD